MITVARGGIVAAVLHAVQGIDGPVQGQNLFSSSLLNSTDQIYKSEHITPHSLPQHITE